MRSLILPVVALSLAGAASAADLTKRKPFIQQQTDKSLGEVSGCISKAWEARSGQTSYIPTALGFTMRLSYNVITSSFVSVQVEAQDTGTARLVTVYARKGDERSKLRNEVEGCM